MDRLSACYFCGAATVVDLAEVRVADDATATVTLCGDCTAKLARLAEAAGAASLSIAAGESADGDASPSPTATETESETSPADGDDADAMDAAGPGIPEDARVFTVDDADDETEDAFEEEPLSEGREPASAPVTSDEDEDGDEGEDGDETTDPRSFAASQAAGGRPRTSHGADERATTGSSEPRTPDEGRADDNVDGTATGDDADGAAADESSESDTDPADVSVATVPRQTYNKVVRLLQNRSFPVERETVVSVAATAYDIDRRDCERTIDALVENGVLDESEDGERLFRA